MILTQTLDLLLEIEKAILTDADVSIELLPYDCLGIRVCFRQPKNCKYYTIRKAYSKTELALIDEKIIIDYFVSRINKELKGE